MKSKTAVRADSKRLPEIKIGSQSYEVEIVQAGTGISGLELNENGCIYYKATRIFIANDLSNTRYRKTLLHEIIHALCFEIGLKGIGEKDVQSFSEILLHTLMDNPEYFGKGGLFNPEGEK